MADETVTEPVNTAAPEEQATTPAPEASAATPAPTPSPASMPKPHAPSPAAFAKKTPATKPRAAAPAAATAAYSEADVKSAEAFGRVDDNGTVFVKDGDAEREVGQFPDVSKEEALALYARRFLDLKAKLDLLATRLASPNIKAREIDESVKLLGEETSEPAVVGDLAALKAQYEELKAAVLQDVVMLKLLGMKPVLSHGGGPGINKMLEKLDIPVQFINGLRYTSEDIMRVVEAVLIGQVNSELVGRINAIGGEAVGLFGISANIYKCVQRSEELGFVGDIVEVNAAPVQALLDAGYIPVVAPVGTDGNGQSFNINGDTAAGKLASALGAEKLMLLTDIEGLCNDIKIRDVISYLNIADVQGLKDQGTIAGGMIPKVDCCVQAIEEGVTNVHIIDGRKPHSILYEAFANGTNQ